MNDSDQSSHPQLISISATGAKSAIDDSSSPFFLHHSDNPGVVLVSQLLTGDNYASWSRAMLIALSVKNKVGFIDGSIQKPDGDGTNPDLISSWIRNNNMVISWILNSVSKDISASIIFVESAHDMWIDLRDRFQQKNGPRIFQLRRELMNLTQDQSSVSSYFTRLKTVWEELSNYRPVCTCAKSSCGGLKELNVHYQMEYIMSFLMGLNDSFSQVRGQILLMDPLPPINKVFALISQEHQRKVGNVDSSNSDHNTSNAMAFAVQSSSDKIKKFPDGFQTKGSKKDRPYCTHCKIHGHIIDRCFKIHGYPPGYKTKDRDNSSSLLNSGSVNNVYSQDSKSNQENVSSNFFQNLNASQYQQLMSMLSNHLISTNHSIDESQNNSAVSFTTGAKREDDWQG